MKQTASNFSQWELSPIHFYIIVTQCLYYSMNASVYLYKKNWTSLVFVSQHGQNACIHRPINQRAALTLSLDGWLGPLLATNL